MPMPSAFPPSTRGGRLRTVGATCQAGRSPLHEELFRLAALVEAGHELAVAVVELGGHALAAAQRLLGRLAPARMRHLGIHVGPEAVLVVGQPLPERDRPLLGELDAD